MADLCLDSIATTKLSSEIRAGLRSLKRNVLAKTTMTTIGKDDSSVYKIEDNIVPKKV
jgi:hypothetical protein